MPTRLDWRLGSGGKASDLSAATDPELEAHADVFSGRAGTDDDGSGRGSRSGRDAGSRLFTRLLGGLVLLAAAGAIGFYVGRWSEARGFVVHGVEGTIALEELAWREGDREIYESTLDPYSSIEWKSAQVFDFITNAPRPWTASVIDLLPVEKGRRIQATVNVSTPGNPGQTTVRYYELRGEQWRRAEP